MFFEDDEKNYDFAQRFALGPSGGSGSERSRRLASYSPSNEYRKSLGYWICWINVARSSRRPQGKIPMSPGELFATDPGASASGTTQAYVVFRPLRWMTGRNRRLPAEPMSALSNNRGFSESTGRTSRRSDIRSERSGPSIPHGEGSVRFEDSSPDLKPLEFLFLSSGTNGKSGLFSRTRRNNGSECGRCWAT